MAEWSKAPDLKPGISEKKSNVRIVLSTSKVTDILIVRLIIEMIWLSGLRHWIRNPEFLKRNRTFKSFYHRFIVIFRY